MARFLSGTNNRRSRTIARKAAWDAKAVLAGERYQETVIQAIFKDPGFTKYESWTDGRKDNYVAWKIYRGGEYEIRILDRLTQGNVKRGKRGYAANKEIEQSLRRHGLQYPPALQPQRELSD